MLTAFKFDTTDGAGQMLDLIQDLSKQELVDIDDAVIVTWPAGKQKPTTQHLHDLVGKGALACAWRMASWSLRRVPRC